MKMSKGKEVKIGGRDPYSSQKKEVKPLKDQLAEHIKLLEDKKVVGYSILFTHEDDHGMATTYPGMFNHILLGYHSELLTDEELAILEIIGVTVSGRIMKIQKEADGKGEEVETENNGGPKKVS